MRRRAGFTLVELLMGLIIMGIVAAALTRVFLSQQRLTVTQVEQASMQANVRTGTLILANELREIGKDDSTGNDILAMGPDSVVYRAMRSFALACGITGNGVRIRQNPIYGARPITAIRDSMLLFVEGSPSSTIDDRWVALPIQGITTSTCLTADSAPAYRLATTAIPFSISSKVRLDAPVRTFEIMEVAPVLAGGHNWLGAHSLSKPGGEVLTPVAGPITVAGLTFTYLDRDGHVTSNRNNVRSIRIVLRGQTDWNVRPGNGLVGPSQPLLDSLVTTVTLRNTRLP